MKRLLTYWKIHIALAVLLTALSMNGAPAAANDQLPPLAAVTDGQLVIYGFGGPRQVTGGDYNRIGAMAWSPDGAHLAFTLSVGNGLSLMLAGQGGGGAVTLAGNIGYLPVTFSSDSSRVIYTVVDSVDGAARSLQVMSQPLNPDAPAEQLGMVTFGVGCGGGSPFPMDGVYNIEAGFGGGGLIFELTDHGLLYSTNCAGQGLALLNTETGENRALGDGLSRVTLAPDRSRFAAVRGNSIIVGNLADGSQNAFSVGASPDQLAWDGANSIYYSVRTLRPEPLPLSPEEADIMATLFNTPPDSVPQYSVSIQRLDLNSGGDSNVYNGPGWAVGRMFTSGGTLYFSLVPNGEAWIEALASGSIDLSTREGILAERRAVAVTMFRLAGDGHAVEAGMDIGQAVPHPSG